MYGIKVLCSNKESKQEVLYSYYSTISEHKLDAMIKLKLRIIMTRNMRTAVNRKLKCMFLLEWRLHWAHRVKPEDRWVNINWHLFTTTMVGYFGSMILQLI